MQYNRVMLGRGGMYAEECRKNGYIGANFDLAQDLTNQFQENFRKFSEKFRPEVMKITGKTKTSAGLSCGFLYTICKSLQKGDVVLCPTGAGSYYVGTIDGDYYYVPNTELPHRRPVKWMDVEIPRNSMSEKLQRVTGAIGTCCDISTYASEIQVLITNAPKTGHQVQVNPQATPAKKFMERDLHPLFCTELRNNNIYAKTIFHEKSLTKVDSAQKWVHPDIVGVELERFHNDATLAILKATEPREAVRLYSYELKKSIETDYQLKQYYFQALSNSSWANYGYLVAFDISESLEEEMERLNSAFGIGIIRMQAKEYQVLYPARERSLDYNTIEKLNKLNGDFKSFITEVSHIIDAPTALLAGAKLSLEKNCDKVFDTNDEIEDYCKKNGIPF